MRIVYLIMKNYVHCSVLGKWLLSHTAMKITISLTTGVVCEHTFTEFLTALNWHAPHIRVLSVTVTYRFFIASLTWMSWWSTHRNWSGRFLFLHTSQRIYFGILKCTMRKRYFLPSHSLHSTYYMNFPSVFTFGFYPLLLCTTWCNAIFILISTLLVFFPMSTSLSQLEIATEDGVRCGLQRVSVSYTHLTLPTIYSV